MATQVRNVFDTTLVTMPTALPVGIACGGDGARRSGECWREVTQVQNIKMDVKGKTLTIKVDLSADTTPSKSGKTEVIASTRGNQQVIANGHGHVVVGINVYRPV